MMSDALGNLNPPVEQTHRGIVIIESCFLGLLASYHNTAGKKARLTRLSISDSN